jgi:cell division septation protein DedD
MEKKQTQRIIGILVVVALIIIIMPLLFGKNDTPTQEASNVSAPPLPDQQAATITATNTVTPDAAPAENNAVSTDAVATSLSTTSDATANQPDAQPIAQPGVIQQPETSAVAPEPNQQAATTTPQDVKKIDSTVTAAPVEQPSVNNTAANNVNPVSGSQQRGAADVSSDVAKNLNGPKESSIIYERPSAAEPVKTTYPPVVTVDKAPVSPEQPVVENEVHVQKTRAVMHHSHKSKIKSVVAKNKKVITHIGSVNTAWAVQMGSFKVKQNAVTLASKLRSAGYKAFTREIKSAQGNVSTRVYIGPEVKLASAAKLSKDVHHHFNMQGIVIPYEPLV